MAIAFDFPMFDINNDAKLSKSADSLESALARLTKNASVPIVANNDAANNLYSPAISNDGNGFDEWLASDLQMGALTNDDASLSSSPFSALEDSPVLGFDSFGAALGPSLFDMSMSFNVGDFSSVQATPVTAPVVPVAPKVAPTLTTAAVQQAAAALNIPWSRDLELAVMAQAASQATPILSVNTNVVAPLVPKMEPLDLGFTLGTPVSSVPTTPLISAAKVSVSAAAQKKRAVSPEEEQDEIVAKRAKNTDAARRSRLKKLIKLEGLESKVADLESANTRLTMKVAVLETEKNGHIVKEAEQNARIAQLEAKLAEAHAALTSRA